MTQVDAVYQNGVFKPSADVLLPDNQRVRLIVQPLPDDDAGAWLARVQQQHRQFISDHGCLPNSAPDIAEDRKR